MKIFILGSIGVGKTTFINKFIKKNKNYIYIDESYLLDNPLFSSIYNDDFDKDFELESTTFFNRLKEVIDFNNDNSNNYIIERSILDSLFVFAKYKFDKNKLTQNEYNILLDYFKYFEDKIISPEDRIIYLYCDDEKQIDRINNRKRKEEKNISTNYLKDINKYYENLVNTNKKIEKFNINNINDMDIIIETI